jgi:hypothetical protein
VTGACVVEHLREERGQRGVGRAALDGERTLGGCGQHLQGVEQLARLVDAAQAAQPCGGDHHGVELPRGDLADAGVDVAPDRHDAQTQAERLELGDPPRRAGTDRRSCRQLAEHPAVAGDQRVARVLPRRDRGDHEPRVRCRGEVLVGVHGDVDLVRDERVAQLRDEHADAQ